MTRQEIQNNTPEQVREYLTAAVALLEELELPAELLEVAFGKAVDLFAGKQIIMAQPQPIDLSSVLTPGRRQ